MSTRPALPERPAGAVSLRVAVLPLFMGGLDRTGVIWLRLRSELSAWVMTMFQSPSAMVDQPVRVKVTEPPSRTDWMLAGSELTPSQWVSSGTHGASPRAAFLLDQLRCTVNVPARIGASESHRSAHSWPLARNHSSLEGRSSQ